MRRFTLLTIGRMDDPTHVMDAACVDEGPRPRCLMVAYRHLRRVTYANSRQSKRRRIRDRRRGVSGCTAERQYLRLRSGSC